MDKYVVYTYHEMLFSHEEKGILPFATTWIDLEDIMLSEVSISRSVVSNSLRPQGL